MKMAVKSFSPKGKLLQLLGILVVLNGSMCNDNSSTSGAKYKQFEDQEEALSSQAEATLQALSDLVNALTAGKGGAKGIQKASALVAKLRRITDKLLSNLRARLKIGEDALGASDFEEEDEEEIRLQLEAYQEARALIKRAAHLQLASQQGLQQLAGILNRLEDYFLSEDDDETDDEDDDETDDEA